MQGIKYVKLSGVACPAPYIAITVNGISLPAARIDTGADISVMPKHVCQAAVLGYPITVRHITSIENVWTYIVDIELLGKKFRIPVLRTDVSEYGLLGIDILKHFKLELIRDEFNIEILEDEDG